MREKLFTLTRSQRDDLWRRYKQTTERRVAERLHAILLLDEGRSASDVSAILHLHPKTLKRWISSSPPVASTVYAPFSMSAARAG